ncbi:hypothetical protein [Sphaerisporangium rufum]|uniref:hypothetical protein n=1 Tax=Sphaerisporangium rufum TaxID=1381558 RepID=UPI001EF272B8|nr:hypothetical protein [Sphaerisporangium rufum]
MRHEAQVLICPSCQREHDLDLDLDRCRTCGSSRLICRLGEVECRSCGAVRPARVADARPSSLVGAGAPGLSEEVEAALGRLFGRHPAR